MSSDVLSVDATYPGDRKKRPFAGIVAAPAAKRPRVIQVESDLGVWWWISQSLVAGDSLLRVFCYSVKTILFGRLRIFGTSGSTTKHGNNLVQSSPKHLEVTGIGPDHPSNGLMKTTRRDNLWVKWGYPLVIYSPHWSIGNHIFSRTMVDPPWNRSSFNHWWVPLWLANGSTGQRDQDQTGKADLVDKIKAQDGQMWLENGENGENFHLWKILMA